MIMSIILHKLISVRGISVWYRWKAHHLYFSVHALEQFSLKCDCMVSNHGSTFHSNIF